MNKEKAMRIDILDIIDKFWLEEFSKEEACKAILALIEQEQKQSRMAGYDDGVEVGKALQSVEDEKKIKLMVEALSLARFHIGYLKGGMNPEDRLPSTDKVIAKIDSILKEVHSNER